MQQSIKSFLLVSILLFGQSSLLLFSQSVNHEALKTKFSDERAIFLDKNEHLFINYEKGAWKVYKDVEEDMYYLRNDGNVFAEKEIFYTGFEKILNINAKTLVPIAKGKKIKYEERPVTKIETNDVLMNSIFYSDYKQQKFIFPSVEEKAMTSLTYTEEILDPHMLGAFYFGSYLPIVSSTFKVTVPEHIDITYKLVGENTSKIKFSKTKKNKITTYTWEGKDIPKQERASDAPHPSYYTPHVIVYINKVMDGDKEKLVLEDTKGLYRWYSSLVKDVNKEEDEELKKIVKDLVANATTDAEKIKLIYQWVQNNIKYVAFEDGLGGFVPREAKDVCQKKYGDCKDMSSIIVKMLQIAEVDAHLTWIGTRDRPYSYYDVPSPIVDNHMIASAKIDGKTVFLDATGEYVPFGFPTSMIQGKEALIGLNTDEFKIERVPIIPKEENVTKENIELTIVDKNLIGTANLTSKGYKKVFAEYARMRAESEDNEQFFDDFLQKGNNKFEITAVTDKGYFDRNEPIQIDYQFKIPNYAKKAAGKLYVNLNLNKKYKGKMIDVKKRKLDKEIDFKYMEETTTTLQIPDDYVVEYLPENSQYENDLFGFSINYTQEEGKVTMTQKVYMDYLILEMEEFEIWNEMIKSLKENYQEVVVLKEQ